MALPLTLDDLITQQGFLSMPRSFLGSAGHTGAFLLLSGMVLLCTPPSGGIGGGAAVPGTHNLSGLASKGTPVTDLGNYLPLKKNISEKLRAKGR